MSSSVSEFFEEEPDRLVVKTSDLKILPVTLKIDGKEEVRDMIVLECDDLTGRFREGYSYRFSPSRKRGSKWQLWLKACSKNLGRPFTQPKDILGRFYETMLETWTWGEGIPDSTVPVFVKELTEEEAKALAKEIAGNVSPTSNNAEMEYVVGLLDGKTYNEAIQSVVSDSVVSKDQELVSKIVSKDYMTMLIEAEMLEVDEDGRYHKFQI